MAANTVSRMSDSEQFSQNVIYIQFGEEVGWGGGGSQLPNCKDHVEDFEDLWS